MVVHEGRVGNEECSKLKTQFLSLSAFNCMMCELSREVVGACGTATEAL